MKQRLEGLLMTAWPVNYFFYLLFLIKKRKGWKLKGFRESHLAKTLGFVKNNPKNMLHIILFDILFLAAIGAFYKLTEFFFLKTPPEISVTTTILYLILTLMYYLTLILIYSFFKYSILNSIKSLFKKTKRGFSNLKKFYLLNLLIFVALFMAFLVLNGVFLIGVKEEYAAYVFLIINVPLFLIAYIFMNIGHTLFSETEKPKIKEIVRKAFNLVLEVKRYWGIFLADMAVIIAYFTVFYLIGMTLKATVFKSYLTPAKYYDIYTMGFSIITTLFFYFLFFFNRVYFYNIIKKSPIKK